MHDAGALPCDSIQAQLLNQIERIDHQIRDLRHLKTELKELLARWQQNPVDDGSEICPNLHI